VRSQTRYMTTLLAATAISGAIIMGPVALAGWSAAAVPDAMLKAAAANPKPSPTPASPAQTAGDPQVPSGTTLGFDSNSFDGNSLAS
jgi:hypothetical protein